MDNVRGCGLGTDSSQVATVYDNTPPQGVQSLIQIT